MTVLTQQTLTESDCDETDEDESLQSEEQDVELEENLDFSSFNFRFQREGELVAVYFVEDYYIGEVVRIASPSEAHINFMERANFQRGRPIFRWPVCEDKCNISAEVVFASDICLQPLSSSGRAFSVEKPDRLPERYAAFKDHL